LSVDPGALGLLRHFDARGAAFDDVADGMADVSGLIIDDGSICSGG
jgi:hypothetical protein